MRLKLLIPAVILPLIGGSCMSAGEAHPNGPDTDKRPWVTRTFPVEGSYNNLLLTLTIPEPRPDGTFDGETLFDPMKGKPFKSWDPEINPSFFHVRYPFRGHFWQGIFGSVFIGIEVVKRAKKLEFDPRFQAKPDPMVTEGARVWNELIRHPWKQTGDICSFWEHWGDYQNQLQTKTNHPENRHISTQPQVVLINGIECLRIIESHGSAPRAQEMYYFLLESDCQVQLTIQLVDNSDRPGLAKSDWRPRAEALAARIIESLKVRVEPRRG